jgi:hypothetical protein
MCIGCFSNTVISYNASDVKLEFDIFVESKFIKTLLPEVGALKGKTNLNEVVIDGIHYTKASIIFMKFVGIIKKEDEIYYAIGKMYFNFNRNTTKDFADFTVLTSKFLSGE